MDPTAVPSSSQRRIRRRWRVPPAIMHGSEALESAGVLEEFPGYLGLVLWQSLRDVTLWAATPPAERDDLFSEGAERNRIAGLLTVDLDAEVEQPLGMLTALVGRPGRVSPERVALACRHLSQWAERQGKTATALAFAQAGAVSCPGDASAGYKVGQLARKRAEYVRAETWFRRSIALARQEGDWTSYAMAFSGLGNLYLQRGNLPKARSLHGRALRAATRHSLRSIQGDALHDLFVVCAMLGDADLAQGSARRAFETYGPRHTKIPVLAQDVAYFWLEQGQFSPALSVFQSLRRHVGRSIDSVVLLPNIARAAGGAGERAVFEGVWIELQPLFTDSSSGRGHAEALLELARGAASLAQWDRAEAAASRAAEMAGIRSEARVQFEAEALLQAVHAERCVLGGAAAVATLEVDELLAGEFVDSLNELAAVG